MKKILLSLTILFSSVIFASSEVNVYSQRHYDSDKKLFKEFEAKTGIKVNLVSAKAEELVSRLSIEGANSPADILITADIGNLYLAKQRGLVQNIKSDILNKNIPSHLRDEDGAWFALTKRARIVVYNPKTVDPKDLEDYFSLINPKFKGKIVTRTSTHPYNKSLIASIIAHHGEEKALEFTKGIANNFARNPKGGDKDQVRAVASGEADLAIVNSYYLGVMANSKDKVDEEIAKEVKIFFPAQNTTGTHINISGASITKFSPNKQNAIKLIEFLTSVEAQGELAEGNYEYPVNPKVKPAGIVASWGEFKEDQIPLNEVGKYTKEAVEIATKGRWK
ncbi:Iron uptake protein A1 precursor [Aliarcobacter thereius]|uniref:Fe(3+) ABC transporter substrate-binding protein n=2 Tax=Aliarcobacter thereius TaxID=544718 RepID=A0A1C0B996_9BACT|nr:Fe(3+) ABC transporter substrate-binding protein [Aliarcobacter thereius]OCL88690.1 Iron uptake protein A1 precursor [Aliarcobacter thereius]OCL92185.1 Iron uptake protein A1 precursor [Aliarcobacter thereius]OCL94719.1 Iron uptake protein A1 precursor [Aliarcobacter thereius LMG 24486]OCM00165.1 Iron uptake protein A1 precursor [Aliarcobacter thereius]QBF15405.1 iron(III) ABC transporter, periplasmic iron-binding protein [Aliarcobacter thereius LMG 24486]